MFFRVINLTTIATKRNNGINCIEWQWLNTNNDGNGFLLISPRDCSRGEGVLLPSPMLCQIEL